MLALGGGVVGDLAGLAASLVRRGIRFVQVPTSLLAQVDSSVGGKTGINTPQGKNLIGTFHQPSLVLADTDLLATLPAREFRAGYVEAAKYGLLGDAAFFGWLEQNWRAVLAHERHALTNVVATSVRGKAAIVARDETETGDRMLLNLGHTFGHALEAWAGYSQRLLHGEAIAIGICLAFQLCRELGLVDAAGVQRVAAHFAAVGLPTTIADIPGAPPPDAAALMTIMGQDKKVRDGRLTLILVRAIGAAFVSRDISRPDGARVSGTPDRGPVPVSTGGTRAILLPDRLVRCIGADGQRVDFGLQLLGKRLINRRWRARRDLPANTEETTSTRKWLSPVRASCDDRHADAIRSTTSSRVGASARTVSPGWLASTDTGEPLVMACQDGEALWQMRNGTWRWSRAEPCAVAG